MTTDPGQPEQAGPSDEELADARGDVGTAEEPGMPQPGQPSADEAAEQQQAEQDAEQQHDDQAAAGDGMSVDQEPGGESTE